MIAEILRNSSDLTPVLLGLVGSAGVVGTIIAFVKLPADKTTAAVSQAQGANEILQETLEAVERERDYWRRRYEMCLAQHRQLVAELGLQQRLEEE